MSTPIALEKVKIGECAVLCIRGDRDMKPITLPGLVGGTRQIISFVRRPRYCMERAQFVVGRKNITHLIEQRGAELYDGEILEYISEHVTGIEDMDRVRGLKQVFEHASADERKEFVTWLKSGDVPKPPEVVAEEKRVESEKLVAEQEAADAEALAESNVVAAKDAELNPEFPPLFVTDESSIIANRNIEWMQITPVSTLRKLCRVITGLTTKRDWDRGELIDNLFQGAKDHVPPIRIHDSKVAFAIANSLVDLAEESQKFLESGPVESASASDSADESESEPGTPDASDS